MRKYHLIVITLFLSINLQAQQVPLYGGGGYQPQSGECVPVAQRIAIEHMLDSNRSALKAKGLLKNNTTQNKDERTTSTVLFSWPLLQSGTSYYSYYGIANFVDHDPTYPSHVLDWNCGTRTYDNASGYNHAGTDIFLWPFSWNLMDAEAIHIVAAAPGTIIGKSDGHYDRDCAMSSTAVWNAVYVQHTDGTVAWYGHMKSGTLTTKVVGDTVALGEYLGCVGSSGSSTGPHLHFEVHDSLGNVRDPYTGTCNTLPSLWTVPKTYYESQINALMTHSAPPVFTPCPTDDTTNEQDTFLVGSTITFATYYHDQLAGQLATDTVFKPDGSRFSYWTIDDTTAWYSASYWYYTWHIPSTEPLGRWTYKVSFLGVDYTHYFYIVNSLGTNTIMDAGTNKQFFPNPAGNVIYCKDNAAKKVEIYNTIGQLVYENDAVKGEIDIANLRPGLYFIKTSDGYIQKFNKL